MPNSRKTLDGRKLYVGLMSGTSADGIDAVVVELAGNGLGLRTTLLAHVYCAFKPSFRKRLLAAALQGTVAEICELNFILGEEFAQAALAAIRRAKLKRSQISAIGSHGQTVHHLPNATTPSTLQIGEPCVIAERTGITTVADFRVRDMAAGGQGAPLVPFADWVLFTDKVRPRIVQNIGGIGNLTYLPPHARLTDVIAFDTGPGNMIIDATVAALSKGKLAYDRDGRWAGEGKTSEKLLAYCVKHPFLRRSPPKTTGREEFGETFLKRFLSKARQLRLPAADIVATATDLTAASIADAYHRFILPRLSATQFRAIQIILGGGGVKNTTLVQMIQDRTGFGTVCGHEDFGIASSAKEPMAFAILAHETLNHRPGNVPSATGARRPVILGKIVTA
ncbi:MAG TPA: anhydro-N-acetylmuramic acid kinase [Verrucomicrobiae bacterium]|nr:anhydro-N-acetylmuramic acid kinase [Verrucomicrobiae bacterium]